MKYSSLFTHPSQAPINRAYDEVKSRLNSSPLFTALHLCLSDNHKGGIRQFQLPSLLFLLEFDEQISLSLLDLEISEPFSVSISDDTFFTIPHAIIIF